MGKKRKIAVVTVSRAEYGILKNLLTKLQDDNEIELQLIVTGSHLMEEMGSTFKEIEKDFEIAKKVDMKLESDTPQAVSAAMGEIVKNMSKALEELSPDLLVLISDRYETIAAAVAAIPFNIPIAHIAGGVVTQGAIDDKIRHAITKLSHLHFSVDEEGYNNLLRMGEERWRIKNTGSMSIDLIKNTNHFTKEEVVKKLQLDPSKKIMLFVYHPVTLEYEESFKQIRNILDAITEFDMNIVAFYPNQDTARNIIASGLDRRATVNKNIKLVKHLERRMYHSLMKHCDTMVGNSSSALLEAPSFKTAAVNIGNRQKGRPRVENVIDCGYKTKEIVDAIKKALSNDFRDKLKYLVNPFGDGNAASRIFEVIKNVELNEELIEKNLGGQK